jgi:outer membrane protein assembly factor BamB
MMRRMATGRIARLRLACRCLAVIAAASCERPTQPGSGRVLWHVDGKGWGTPTFDNTTAYFVGYDHELVAVNKTSGRLLWHGHESDPGSNTNGRSAVIAASIVAIGDADIHGFDRVSGARRWDFHPAIGYDPGLYDITSDGQTIFAGSPSGHVYAIDGATGVQQWVTAVAADDNSGTFDPVLEQGILYVCVKHFTNPTSGGVVALDAQTGGVRWTQDLPANPPFGGAACNLRVAISGDLVVAASDAGKIYAFDRLTGAIRWTAPQLSGLPPGSYGSPDADYRPLIASRGLIIAGGRPQTRARPRICCPQMLTPYTSPTAGCSSERSM